MKTVSFSSAILLALLAAPLTAWADHNPDFDDDAKPILRMQPGLLAYVENTFQVKDTGIAKIPGDDDRHAQPPYIFQAKPRGYPGAYYLTMLIQPGSPGHILKIVDPTKPNGGAPTHAAPAEPAPTMHSSSMPPSHSAPTAPVNPPSVASKAPVSVPTSDTPSGPLTQNTPSLEPPPDPAPATH
ncbi:MAG TPA: hypothetical protein VGC39_08490 [Candidatus Methylacidiphilales bacterium]